MKTEEIDFMEALTLRTKAEELLKAKQQEESISHKETDEKRLLHELQVHQIELKMQNEELRQAYEPAELALKNYTMIFELTLLGYFLLESEGTILDLNFVGADLLGERRFTLINNKFNLFVSDESISLFNDFLERVYTSTTKESCSVLLGSEKKGLRSVYMEGLVIDEEQKCLLSVIETSKFGVRNR